MLLLVISFRRSTFISLEPHYATFFASLLQILIHVGFLTEESGDVFSPKVLKGGPLGEMVQWADILTALHVLGHNLKISMSVKELQGWVEIYQEEDVCCNGVVQGIAKLTKSQSLSSFQKTLELLDCGFDEFWEQSQRKKTYIWFSAVAHAHVYALLSFTTKMRSRSQ